IFDYAAKENEEAYIVTEFIDGQTLKQFVTERPIAFPEIGAMIMLQVCRALAHAHAGGILHRDVKPENIMIRSDGVVKLMDFGISHMVDLERLTVTGQLLGSPAYMAPEHVEGRPLDFRTDVFAAGIVLYQLCVGKLPFEGKNPHEVLKRIAECKFVDPRQANPRIGNRLGRIILRAMAAMPNDRYPAIGEMVLAIEAYLEESGLPPDKVAGELARYFQAPASYEQALRDRLVDHLTRRGTKLLADGDQAPALDVFDRVLTIDPKNEKVLAILDGINRRARMKQVGLAVLGIAVLAGGGYLVHRKNLPPRAESPVAAPPPSPPHVENPVTSTQHEVVPPPQQIVQVDAAPQLAVQHDAAVTVPVDAAPALHEQHIRISPTKNVEYKVGDGAWLPVPDGGAVTISIDRETKVYVKDTSGCCQADDKLIKPGDAEALFEIYALPAHVKPTCARTVTVKVDGKETSLGEPFTIPFGKALSRSRSVKVEFTDDKRTQTKEVTAEAGKDVEVACDAP
ncbi:MAG TPA: serine/threonine-protein kinase, partial [Kofleriaceae bacterium]|nr:serine/threonine-protein kinase [Kofleriaceae bacterium]